MLCTPSPFPTAPLSRLGGAPIGCGTQLWERVPYSMPNPQCRSASRCVRARMCVSVHVHTFSRYRFHSLRCFCCLGRDVSDSASLSRHPSGTAALIAGHGWGWMPCGSAFLRMREIYRRRRESDRAQRRLGAAAIAKLPRSNYLESPRLLLYLARVYHVGLFPAWVLSSKGPPPSLRLFSANISYGISGKPRWLLQMSQWGMLRRPFL